MGIHDMARLYQLMSKARHYREFGSGGSTVQAVGFSNIQKIVTTESDKRFVAAIKARSDTQEALASGRLVLQHADIGPTQAWGMPKDSSHQAQWPAYSFMNNSLTEFNPPFSFDLVFIDGRFRAACFLRAIQATKPERIDATVFVVHDYTSRKQYHFVEDFAERITIAPEAVEAKWWAKAKSDVFLRARAKSGPKRSLGGSGDDELAIFRKRANVDEQKLDAAIEKNIMNLA
jgi:hypothetical protein